MTAAVLIMLLGWPLGTGLASNIAASAICAVIGWVWLLRKLHCSQPKCFRVGRHEVTGTTFRTCQKHATRPVHENLQAVHARDYPEQHAHLNNQEASV